MNIADVCNDIVDEDPPLGPDVIMTNEGMLDTALSLSVWWKRGATVQIDLCKGSCIYAENEKRAKRGPTSPPRALKQHSTYRRLE